MYTIVRVPTIKEGYCEIYAIGDKHYGVSESHQDRELIKTICRTVLFKNAKAKAEGKDPYCFIIGVGDTLDLSIKDKFGLIGKDKAVNQALRDFKNDFREVALNGYYLGDVPGNHDVRITDKIGSPMDLVEEWLEEIREQTGIEIAYGCPHLLIDLKVAKSAFTGFVTHGSGGGGTPGSIANQMFKSVNEVSNADFYLQGHFHRDVYVAGFRPYYDRQNRMMMTQTQHFFSLGSLFKKHGYAAVSRLPYTGTSAVLLKFYAADNRHVKKIDFDIIWGRCESLQSKLVGFKPEHLDEEE